jgi:hypothetical protein
MRHIETRELRNLSTEARIQSAVAASLCRRTPNSGQRQRFGSSQPLTTDADHYLLLIAVGTAPLNMILKARRDAGPC